MKQLKNFLIKREQSQTRLSFAECEKSRLIAKLSLTLVALLSMATGAWAQDADEVAVTKTANNNEWTLTMPASNVELQVEYEPSYNVTFNTEGLDAEEAAKFTASPNTGVYKGETVTVTYTGTKRLIGVKAEKKSEAPKTALGAALVNGATLEVLLHPDDDTDLALGGKFTYNDGTFTLNNILGTDFDGRFANATVDGTTITFNAGFFNAYYNHTTTFNIADDTYVTTGAAYHGSIYSVKVNGTDVTSQLTEVK